MAASVRVDVWLWSVRVFKTRSQATTACRAGHVQIAGERVKAARPVAIGDTVRVRLTGQEKILEVTGLLSKRVGAVVAAQNYIDHSPPPLPALFSAVPRRERGSGRPTKKERRQLDRLRSRPEPLE